MKVGYVGIFGLTNSGKSTLLNTLVGQKVSIVSNKDQTTLVPIYGILTKEDYQIIFIDTPGIQKPHSYFDTIVQNNIKGATLGLDIIIHLVDEKYSPKDDYVLSLYRELNLPVILAINKLDLLRTNEKVDEIIISFLNKYNYQAYIPLSSTNKKNVDHLLEEIIKLLPSGQFIYDPEEVTNQTMNRLICDIVREKTTYFTAADVKSGFYVEITHHDEQNYYLEIVVAKENHKKMIIGTGASVIKKIKLLAKKDLKRNYDLNINLELFVKVDENWKENINKINSKAF
ncbi:MAG: GTPase Era [Acholeplasmatales bacterium]|jgi:GTP-binding protein Era|nr:GTPase Era [Acholeplasmatales bacterium]